MTRAQSRRQKKVLESEKAAERGRLNTSAEVSKNLIASDPKTGVECDLGNELAFHNAEGNRRGFIYMRVSSEAQDSEDSVSLAEQRIAIHDYCVEQRIDIVEAFQDVAPGRTKERPAFQRMLSEIRKGNVDVIVCWKGDRLARSVSPANALLEALEGTDTELAAVKERIDKQYFVLLAWFGGLELENLRDRSIMGKRGRAKGGLIPCRNICFGYDVGEDGRPKIAEAEAKTVQYIYRLYIEYGLGTIKVAERLNEEGIPSPRGGRWAQSVVNGVICHPAYKGIWQYGKYRHEYTNKGIKKTKQPEHERIQIEVPQIIDEKTWQRAQEVKKERTTNAKRNTRIFYLLQHQMYCEPCGHMMGCLADRKKTTKQGGKTRKIERTKPLRYYLCYGYREGYKCRERPYVPAELLEDAVWSATKHIVSDPQVFLSGLEPQEVDVQEDGLLNEEIKRVENILEDENRAKRFLIRKAAKQEISEEELDEQLIVMRDIISYNNECLSDLLEQKNATILQEEQRKNIRDYMTGIGQVLDDLTQEQRRELIDNLYTRISIDGENKITLTVALPGDPSTAIAT